MTRDQTTIVADYIDANFNDIVSEFLDAATGGSRELAQLADLMWGHVSQIKDALRDGRVPVHECITPKQAAQRLGRNTKCDVVVRMSVDTFTRPDGPDLPRTTYHITLYGIRKGEPGFDQSGFSLHDLVEQAEAALEEARCMDAIEEAAESDS